MAELMNLEHPLRPKEAFKPFDHDYPGLYRVCVRLPEERVPYPDEDDHPLIVEIMAWMEDPLLKGEYLIYQLTRNDPSFYGSRLTKKASVKGTHKILDRAVLILTDVDTALSCKIHWG